MLTTTKLAGIAGLALTLGCGSGALPPSASSPADREGTLGATESAVLAGGDCCLEGIGPGCHFPDIEACVCAILPDCCTVLWTLECVGGAVVCGGCPAFTDDELAVAALLIDSDNDGLLDLEEIIAGLNPFWPYDGIDNDGDGIDNGDDPDVDGDGTLNAYDDDVDGDGIKNIHDDDIDGDGLLNRIQDDDDDGDGIPNFIDNDDNADGFPDLPDNDGDLDDDGKKKEECELNIHCSKDKVCAAGKCVLAAAAAMMGPVDVVNCSGHGDCEGGEFCGVVLGESGSRPKNTCMAVDNKCDPANDEDGDGLCDDFDSDIDGDGDSDDDDDGLSDLTERILGTDQNNADTDGDGTPDGLDFAPLNDQVDRAEDVEEPDEEEEDDEDDSGLEGVEEPDDGDDEEEMEDGDEAANNPDGDGDEGSSG